MKKVFLSLFLSLIIFFFMPVLVYAAPTPTWQNLGKGVSSADVSTDVTFFSQWTDNVQLSKYIFSWNAGGTNCDTWVNDTAQNFQVGNWTNTTKTIAVACAGKTISFRFFANDNDDNYTYDNWNFSVINEELTPRALTFNGTYFWVVGSVTDRVYRYAYNSTYDNYTYDNWNFSTSGQDPTPNGIVFNGTYFWIAGDFNNNVYRYAYNSTYDNYTYDNWNFSIDQDGNINGITFNGTYFWIVGSGTDRVYRYAYNSTYDNYTYDNWNFSVGNQDLSPTDLFFNGTYFWVVGGDSLPYKVYRYNESGIYNNSSFIIGDQDFSTGITYNGTYFWTSGINNRRVYRYASLINYNSTNTDTVFVKIQPIVSPPPISIQPPSDPTIFPPTEIPPPPPETTFDLPSTGITIRLDPKLVLTLYPLTKKKATIHNISEIEPSRYKILLCNQTEIASYEINVTSDLAYFCANYSGFSVEDPTVSIFRFIQDDWTLFPQDKIIRNATSKIICGQISSTPYLVAGFQTNPDSKTALQTIQEANNTIQLAERQNISTEKAESLLNQAVNNYYSCNYITANTLANQALNSLVSLPSIPNYLPITIASIAAVGIGWYLYLRRKVRIPLK